ncbi:MAG: extensin family protein [Myxococcota bacterium]
MPRVRLLPVALTAMAAALALVPWVAEASDPFLVAPAAEIVERSPAFRYANMSAQAALNELDRRKILYQQVEPHGAVRTPIRLTGKLHGVHIHSALPEHERPTTPFEICDARFALALDDFSALLAKRDIVELIHYTMYRPSVAWSSLSQASPKLGPRWFERSDLAKKSSSAKAEGRPRAVAGSRRASGKRPVRDSEAKPGRSNATQSRHPLGLAIDPGAFVKRDGTVLSVASHFQGRIGAQTCGSGASVPQDPRAQELWSIVCETYDAKIFTYVLTPNFDRPHQDHFHMDIKPGVRWFLYH